MEIIGYIAAGVVGITLGLIGGGGSILAVPILAYLFLFDEKVATAYSLFVVGSAALVGGLKQHFKGQVDWRTAAIFGLPAIAGVWMVRHFVIPILPETIFSLWEIDITRRMFLFGLFAALMLWVAFLMIKGKEKKSGSGDVRYNYPLILLEGLLVGGVTGLVGAGGGFLIIPALVMLANLEIKKAVGTSLLIIALKSLLGFLLGDALQMEIEWAFLMSFTACTVVGIFIGTYISQFVDGSRLKKGFGWFVLIMAVFIFIMEFIIK